VVVECVGVGYVGLIFRYDVRAKDSCKFLVCLSFAIQYTATCFPSHLLVKDRFVVKISIAWSAIDPNNGLVNTAKHSSASVRRRYITRLFVSGNLPGSGP
jgi:hypothetical protein